MNSYAVIVRETAEHTVYVNADSQSEALRLSRDSSNWRDDDLNHSLVRITPVHASLQEGRAL